MDYSKLRRSTNVEDLRDSWGWLRRVLPEEIQDRDTWNDLKHPFSPPSKRQQQPALPSPMLPAPAGSLEAQAGINAFPDSDGNESVGQKGDREDRVPQRFSLLGGDRESQNGQENKNSGASATHVPSMSPAVVDAITRAAKDAGEDPAFALAVAERESNGDPTAHSSKTIHGIYQMRGDLRDKYGVGDSNDPYEQTAGWLRFMGATRQNMAAKLGREPTPADLYLAHHFGEDRATGMLNGRIPGSMPTSDVFSPYEMSINPHFGRAGTVGNLTGSITGDIDRRMARYGGQGGPGGQPDFSSFGQAADEVAPGGTVFPKSSQQSGNSPDFSAFGQASVSPAPTRPGAEVDLSQFDIPSMWTGQQPAVL